MLLDLPEVFGRFGGDLVEGRILLERLEDPSSRVRLAALERVDHWMRFPGMEAAVRERLEDTELEVRIRAHVLLGLEPPSVPEPHVRLPLFVQPARQEILQILREHPPRDAAGVRKLRERLGRLHHPQKDIEPSPEEERTALLRRLTAPTVDGAVAAALALPWPEGRPPG